MKPKPFDSPKFDNTGSQGPKKFGDFAQQPVRCCGRVACQAGFLFTGLALGVLGISFVSGCAGGALSESDSVQETAASAAPTSAEPVWEANLEQALARAAESDMPVLLRFSATWCSPCRVMDATVWPDEQVKATLANHAVPVKIDIDQEATADVVRRYGVRSVPTILLIEPKGDELARGGFMSADALVELLTQSSYSKERSP